ncbi:MAG TPA: DUF72 domain-containing protein [Albitalea sp.]|nr:DUF72 domain-containing protein [Albitalea sp.]
MDRTHDAASRVLVGTASWTDPTLIKCGRFYPKGCSSAEARLAFYASRFPLVEASSSYYGLPTPHNAQLWAERTPAGFTFNIKAFRLFTGHQTPLEALPQPVRDALGGWGKKNIYYKDMPAALREEMWRYFLEGIAPLRAAGKLGALHFQFAPWMMYSPVSKEHIAQCRARLPDDLLAVEFRHQSWFNERHAEQTLAFERELGVSNVVVDEPQGFANSIGAHWAVTNPALALVRLHGRNAATWNIKSAAASDRFNYDYRDDELEELAQRVLRLAQEASRVHVIFNNNFEDQGQRNAATLQRLLQRTLA